MRIFYITNARIPTEKANGYQIMSMCEAFSRIGHEVALVVPKRRNIIGKDAFAYYGIDEIFKIVYRPCLDLFRYESKLGRFCFYLEYFSFLVSVLFLKIDRNSLIYTRDNEIAALMRFRKKQVTVEAHRYGRGSKNIKIAKRIVTVTNEIKKKLVDSGIDENKILVAHDGVDLNNFGKNADKNEARRHFGLPADKTLIGYTGNFTTMGRDKGLYDVIKALALLKGGRDIVFVAVGGKKSEIEDYHKYARELNMEDRAILKDRIPVAKLGLFQQAMDILLMPFPDTEHYRLYMSPLKMFEYMASGRPIIASDLPSVREVLNDNNAYFFRAGDIKNLAAAIETVVAGGEETNKRALKARRDVENYTWEKRAAAIIDFIQ